MSESEAPKDKKGNMAIVTHHVATIAVEDTNLDTIQGLQGMRGVETNVVEKPGEKPKVEITVNTVVIPQKSENDSV